MSPAGRGGMSLRQRIGVDVGRKLPLEQAIEWAAANQVRFIDLQLDTGANALGTIDDTRAAAVRTACDRNGIRLGLHTASAVNVAEYAPYVGDAVEQYLMAYVDAAVLLGAEWIVMHAGFHFTSDREQRMQAGLDRQMVFHEPDYRFRSLEGKQSNAPRASPRRANPCTIGRWPAEI